MPTTATRNRLRFSHANTSEEQSRIFELVDESRHWWEQREPFREERRRGRDYVRGKHWDEIVEDPDNPGESITEKELIERQNRIPWVINQMGSIVRNLQGQFRQNVGETAVFAVDSDDAEGVNQLNVALRGIKRHNRLDVLNPSNFLEHILSGAHCWRVDIAYEPELNRDDVFVSQVDQTRLFYNLDITSTRLDGLRIIGQLHDLTTDQIIAQFATDKNGNYSSALANRMRDELGTSHSGRSYEIFSMGAGFDEVDQLDFHSTDKPDLHRVIEIWYKKHELVKIVFDPELGKLYEYDGKMSELDNTNMQRRALGFQELQVQTRYEQKWHVMFTTPWGFVLDEMRSPYWHEQHPYVLGLSNLVDGETWGLIYQIIDPQRWLNRIVAMVDFSLSASAKGVLMVPEDSIPSGMKLEDFAKEWTKANGVIKIKMKPGAQVPQQIAASAIPGGTFEMLQQLQGWMDTTSGVTGPLRGVDPSAGTPAALFQQQITQSTVTNLDYFESFFQNARQLDKKILQVGMQAWQNPIVITDTALAAGQVILEPDRVRKINFDVSLASVGDTATYRQLFEQDLQQFLGGGFINFGQYLQLSSHPKAKTLQKILEAENPDVLGANALELNAAAAQMGANPGAATAGAANRPRLEQAI